MPALPMRNIGYIFLREFLERVRSKAFIIVTILTPLIFAVIIGLPILALTRSGQRYRIAVAETGPEKVRLLPLLQERLGGEIGADAAGRSPVRSAAATRVQFQLQAGNVEPGREAEARARLRAEVVAGRLDGYLWVAGDPTAGGSVEYHGRSTTDMISINTLERAISGAVVQLRLVSRGIPGGDVQALVRSTRLRTVRVSASGEQEDRGATFILSFFFMMVLYTTLILYGVTIMRSIIEEKNSRIFEVLLSSVKPIELLAGKILGVAGVGLTQYLIWSVLMLLAGGGLGLAAMRSQVGQFEVPGHVLFFFVLYFMLGYFLYSMLFAALGAMVNSEQEAQQLQFLIMPLLIIPMLVFQVVLRAPNGTLATVLSLIPFFSPTLMLLRITVVTPPAWQVALSIVLLLATMALVLWGAARIYRVGILMYGKRPTLPELWRWMKAA